jgi:Asp-tRNA(Asn)/Glu-tRNA(Gln) amidotransferase A subunit family amidase
MTGEDFSEQRARFTRPLSVRRELVERGRIDPATYRADLVAYVRAADPVVRAFADWRPTDLVHTDVPRACSVTYKDTIDVDGYPTRLGIRSGYRLYPGRTAEIARRLSRHGLQCVGKAAVTECALGSVRPSRNPVFPHLSASGSSTGSAVGVAAGFCDVSVGTDSGGSLRWPAVYCGATALRLTPRPGLLAGVHTVSPSMESVGLVVRTPADLAWLWRTHRLGQAFDGGPTRQPGRLRVGISTPPEALHPEVAAMLDVVADALAALGHDPLHRPLGEQWDLRPRAWDLLSREAHDSFAALLGRPDVELGEDTRRAVGRGAGIDDATYAALRELQRHAAASLGALLTADVDVLLLPLEVGLPDPAHTRYDSTLPEPGDAAVDLSMTVVASFARLPVLALPMALSTEGSPVGLQVLARPGGEDLLVAVGELLADIAGVAGAQPVPDAVLEPAR